MPGARADGHMIRRQRFGTTQVDIRDAKGASENATVIYSFVLAERDRVAR